MPVLDYKCAQSVLQVPLCEVDRSAREDRLGFSFIINKGHVSSFIVVLVGFYITIIVGCHVYDA